jgi:hypothetical protein
MGKKGIRRAIGATDNLKDHTSDSRRFVLLQRKGRPKTFLDLLGTSANVKKLLPDMYNALL